MQNTTDRAILTGVVVAFIASVATGLLEIRQLQVEVEELSRQIHQREDIMLEALDRLARIEEKIK